MSRYRFTVEFDVDTDNVNPINYNANPGKWDWPDLILIDDDCTTVDWSTWNVESV